MVPVSLVYRWYCLLRREMSLTIMTISRLIYTACYGMPAIILCPTDLYERGRLGERGQVTIVRGHQATLISGLLSAESEPVDLHL